MRSFDADERFEVSMAAKSLLCLPFSCSTHSAAAACKTCEHARKAVRQHGATGLCHHPCCSRRAGSCSAPSCSRGISNRIILDAFSELLGKERVEQSLQQVTTIHSAGCGGKSDLYDLNGPEISKWIKKECSATLLSATAASSPVSAATSASHSILSRWLQQLHHCLLRCDEWTTDDIESWRAVVDDIQQHWCAETSQAAFPKLHMLRHSLEFAERHRFLGRASEAQIESFHASFNSLFHKQHRNQSSNTAERLRRSR